MVFRLSSNTRILCCDWSTLILIVPWSGITRGFGSRTLFDRIPSISLIFGASIGFVVDESVRLK